MTSLMTNTSAMVALQTLRDISGNLDNTSNRISSGLKIAAAKDNAAYWSIATTMKSDSGALGAVNDSLSLGASIASTAYKGLDTVRNALDKMKEKLTTAAGEGVDRAKVQEELKNIQASLRTTAESASFSGQNWLTKTDPSASNVKNIVASLARDSNNNISLGSIDVDVSSALLFNNASGILDSVSQVTGFTAAGLAVDLTKDIDFSSPAAKVTFDVEKKVGATTTTKAVTIDAATINQALNVSTGKITGDDTERGKALVKVYNQALKNAGVDGVSVSLDSSNKPVFSYATAETAATTFTIKKAVEAGGATAASIGLDATKDIAGGTGTPTNVTVADMNIAGKDTATVKAFQIVIDKALQKVITAASTIGAVQTRIESQQKFVKSLSDTLDKGVGALVDADMEEESTKLKALQTQQQLAIQSLSIANSGSQTVLSLFR